MFESNGSNWGRWDLHVHTASSFDYAYKSEDSDTKLVEAWRKEQFVAVAITDHFKIDATRIENLRELVGNDITIFPGVELRTDKGSSNIHVIIIFDEKSDLKKLESSFESVMLDYKSKPEKSTDENIYWDYNDIIEFANQHDGIISIHSGNKSNGIDDEISNKVPINIAIKYDYANSVDIFEVSRLEDIKGYNNFVFKSIKKRPVIICSDNHDPRAYNVREKLWIKALPTFSGLKQAIIHPDERVFIGEMPIKLESVVKNPEKYIKSFSVRKNNKESNIEKWFEFNLPLNSGLTTIIGNKGSGKSALSDLLAYVGKSDNTSFFSFLNNERFAREDKKYNLDYEGEIIWGDENTIYSSDFSLSNNKNFVPLVRYLPQNYIEETCNNLGPNFQAEIDKVIFSYVNREVRGEATNLKELIKSEMQFENSNKSQLQVEMNILNKKIIELEIQRSTSNKKKIEESLKYYEQELERHIVNKPKVIAKPPKNEEFKRGGLESIANFNSMIESYRSEIIQVEARISKLSSSIKEMTNFKQELQKFEKQAIDVQREIDIFKSKFNIEGTFSINLVLDLQVIDLKISEKTSESMKLKKLISQEYTPPVFDEKTTGDDIVEMLENSSSLYEKIDILTLRIGRAKDLLDAPEIEYQKYKDILMSWETKRNEIMNGKEPGKSLNFFKDQKSFIDGGLNTELTKLKRERQILISQCFELLEKEMDILDSIYDPVDRKIKSLLRNIGEELYFETRMDPLDSFNFELLEYLNLSVSSWFRGKFESNSKIDELVRSHNFSKKDETINFINVLLHHITENEDVTEKLVSNRLKLYNFLCTLDFIRVSYSLTLSGKHLDHLSPGEKGIILLVFYLALDREDTPIIIDQPEDNLDNQSIFSKLVPSIIEAKKYRQVVIVTHNPNIAIACDSELVIYSKKIGEKITYSSGAIEENKTREYLVDVLEGTMPAFTLRKNKYMYDIDFVEN